MIKLTRLPKPTQLTPEIQLQLTGEYKLTGKSVWDLDYIKKGLLLFSNNKCCYCEANIQEESKYLEIEHFYPKSLYEDEVLVWENLLPSCKKCNGTKNKHDTKAEPIIDPSVINPKLHLKSSYYRIIGKDDLGKLTISVLDLNNADRLVKKRFEIGNAVKTKLEGLNETADDYISSSVRDTRKKNSLIQGIKSLMKEGLPSAMYSASTAGIILYDNQFLELKQKIVDENLWDQELEQLETDVREIAFEQ